ncbi:hypothetical protein MTO96_001153 [Rhipicephalus appendiculatus]
MTVRVCAARIRSITATHVHIGRIFRHCTLLPPVALLSRANDVVELPDDGACWAAIPRMTSLVPACIASPLLFALNCRFAERTVHRTWSVKIHRAQSNA